MTSKEVGKRVKVLQAQFDSNHSIASKTVANRNDPMFANLYCNSLGGDYSGVGIWLVGKANGQPYETHIRFTDDDVNDWLAFLIAITE